MGLVRVTLLNGGPNSTRPHMKSTWIHEYTEWGIKISNFSKGHCEGCSGGREVGVVSWGWLASIVVSTHNGLDRWTSGLLLLFPGRLISLTGHVEWPARSPDLSPCDVFLWGYIKEKAFKHRPRSLEGLKERIQKEIDSIPPELTRRVTKSFRERLQQCVANDGCHMSDLIFKTH